MTAIVTIACLFAIQQVYVEPARAQVGDELVVTVRPVAAPMAAIEVSVQLPTGEQRVVGATDGNGQVRLLAAESGQHAFVATVEGIRCVAPFVVAPASQGWLLALGSVPLGLALLWLNLRTAARRSARERSEAGEPDAGASASGEPASDGG